LQRLKNDTVTIIIGSYFYVEDEFRDFRGGDPLFFFVFFLLSKFGAKKKKKNSEKKKFVFENLGVQKKNCRATLPPLPPNFFRLITNRLRR